jgi:nucleoside triphosphate diphosphatase
MLNNSSFGVADLLNLMQRLRDPETGCPWDIKQTYKSITSSTIEEAYEVVDAIEQGDFAHLREELGDLLFQVVFYSQLAREDGHFDFAEVVNSLTAKLIRRHPHVFPDGTLDSSVMTNEGEQTDESVKQRWEEIKSQERVEKGRVGLLDDVPLALPAMTRAVKLQKRSAQVGFDWPSSEPVMAKLKEELVELEHAMAAADDEAISDELGDVLFSVVNLARHLKRDPEKMLRAANQKFTRRFQFIEQTLSNRSESIEEVDPMIMEALWQEAKNRNL